MPFKRPCLPLRHPAAFLATWGGVGLLARAPGTFGSLAALPFAWAIHGWLGHGALLAAAAALFAAGWWASARYMRASGAGEDPQEIVIDEVAGQWLLLSLLPRSLMGYAAGFLLFRLFDVAKPWPVSFADRRVKGGLGVMLDDLLAACYPVVLLALLSLLDGWFGTGMNAAALWKALE